MSASLIGRLRSSAFRLSTTTVSMSLAGSCFSPESAPRPFHYGVRGGGGTILATALPSDERQGLAAVRTHVIQRWVELEFPSVGFNPARFSCCCRGLFPGPAELGAVNPYAVQDHSQAARQGHDRLFHPAAFGNLHRPGLEPRPSLRIQHALGGFVEHDPHHLISAA